MKRALLAIPLLLGACMAEGELPLPPQIREACEGSYMPRDTVAVVAEYMGESDVPRVCQMDAARIEDLAVSLGGEPGVHPRVGVHWLREDGVYVVLVPRGELCEYITPRLTVAHILGHEVAHYYGHPHGDVLYDVQEQAPSLLGCEE